MIVLPNIRPATQADTSAQPAIPQAQAESTSAVGSFRDSVVAAISANKEQDGSKSQGEKQTRDRNGNADGSDSQDSKTGSATDTQAILYVPAIYIPVVQAPETQPAAESVSATGAQDGADSNALNLPVQKEPLSFLVQNPATSAQILAVAPQSASNAVANSTFLPGNLLKGTPVVGFAGSESTPVSNGALLSNNNLKSTRAAGHSGSEPGSAIASSVGNEAVSAINDHSQVNAGSSPATHENHQTQAGMDAPNQTNANSPKTSDAPKASDAPKTSDVPTTTTAADSAAMAALAQLAPQATPVPTNGSQAMAEMLTQAPRPGGQSKVAGVEGTSAKSVDGVNPESSAVAAKSSVQDKDSKVAESQQNQSRGSQDGTSSNQDQSSTQFAVSVKEHITSFQNITGASTASSQPAQLQGAPTDPLHSTKTGVPPEALASNIGQSHTDVSNTGLPTQPMVNTARLIQSINSSELKLGMQSEEFGKISITTSTTRDAVLAQIYVDHSELAKTLTTNLPELQSRVSGQSFDIRVATTSGASGMSANTSSGDANQQAYQQQRNNQSFTRGIAPLSTSTSVGSAVVAPDAQHVSLIDNRLDLRV